MSLASIPLGFLSLGPRVWMREGCLHARTSLVVQLLGLFCYCKRLEVDPILKIVTLRTRYLWFIPKRREIPFDRIQRIDYDLRTLPTSWSILGETTDQIESFVISLCLIHPSEKVLLYSFGGAGSVATGWTGVFAHGDSILDLSGTQCMTSRKFVMLLKKMTGKPLV